MSDHATRADRWLLGKASAAAGQWVEATRIFDSIACESVADEFSIPSLLQASGAQLQLGEYRRARRYALDAAAVRPSNPDAIEAVARAMNLFCEPEPLAALVDATRLEEVPVGALVELVQILSGFGMHDRAADVLEAIADKGSDTAHSRYLRALIHMFQGRLQQAEAELESCLLLSRDFAPAYWLLSQVGHLDAAPARAARIGELLGAGGWSDVAAGYLEYALHNELHELGRYEEAWEALERGCLARKRVVSWKRQEASQLFSSLKSLDASAPTPVPSRGVEPTPIFIVGMHRSGTSLLERILGGHSLVADGGESYAFAAQVKQSVNRFFGDLPDPGTIDRLRTADFPELGRNYLDAVRWRAGGKPFLTEKLPSNFIHAGTIAKALPQAKILHMVRDPVDTCFSNLRTHFSTAAAYSYDQVDLAAYYAQYEDLMAHWHSVIPSRMLAVAYGELVHSTEATARRIFDFCGLPYEEGALHVGRESGPVSTASSAIVRKGIRKDRGNAWKPYERHLQPLIGHLKASGLI